MIACRSTMALAEVLGASQNLMTLVFWALIGADHRDYISLVDPEYKQNGFCVATHATQGFNSFQLSFFIDTVACLAMLATKNGRDKFFGFVCTVLVHGLFHLVQYIFGWPFPPEIEGIANIVFIAVNVGGFGIGSRVGTMFHWVAVTAAIEIFRRAFVPDVFLFAYTNTYIYGLNAFVGIMSALHNVQDHVNIPANFFFLGGVVVPFFEAIMCNRGFKDLGGHAIFDLVIALGLLVTVFTTKDNLTSKKQE